MTFTKTPFKDLIICEPKIHGDSRGYFFESYNHQLFLNARINYNFIQDNQAFSEKNVVRGLHFQHEPHGQVKLIRCLKGAILDVVLDLRFDEETYGHSFIIELTEENKKQLLVPVGFAHGYATLSNKAEVFYKCNNYYNPNAEGGINLKDENLNINWQINFDNMILSEKDKKWNNFNKEIKIF